MPEIVTRFAPSPTGMLHLGGARTALFNFLFARHHHGRFRLRIEDTDKARSSEAATKAICDELNWLGLNWDEEIVYQSSRAARHREIAEKLVSGGHAYHCYCTREDLDAQRAKARAEGRPLHYDGRCRTRESAPSDQAYVIRIKSPQSGKIIIPDAVQGEVSFAQTAMDDFILSRSDGSPTYMLCVVVDDHDMGVTHIIRGVDHLTNAARQGLIYSALNWEMPIFAHIPLIHGADGAKLSKRHGAENTADYRQRGYLPQAMRNYLVRLGWAHGDDEIFSDQQAIEWFSLNGVGRSAAKFDPLKLDNLNAHYLRKIPADELLANVLQQLNEENYQIKNKEEYQSFIPIFPRIAERSKTLTTLAQNAKFLFIEPQFDKLDEKSRNRLTDQGLMLLEQLIPYLEGVDNWESSNLEQVLRAFEYQDDRFKDKIGQFKDFAQPLRIALTGATTSPSIFSVVEVLGKKETLDRITRIVNDRKSNKHSQ